MMKKHRITLTTDELANVCEALEQFVDATPRDIPEYPDIVKLFSRIEALHLKAQGEPEEGY